MRKFALLALVLALTGCSATTPAPAITPVDHKICALSDASGFNDDGLNRFVYAALQQLKVQTGSTIQATEVGAGASAAKSLDQFVKSGCAVILTAGDSLIPAAVKVADANPFVQFVAVNNKLADYTNQSSTNLQSVAFNMSQAAFAAGFLAADVAASGPLQEQRILVLDKIHTAVSAKSSKAFTLGVARFNALNAKSVQVSSASADDGSAIIFAIAGNSSELGVLVSNSSQLPRYYIGFGRDWYADARNKNLRNQILTSVVRVDPVSRIVEAVVSPNGALDYNLANSGVGLAATHGFTLPANFESELKRIAQDFANGNIRIG